MTSPEKSSSPKSNNSGYFMNPLPWIALGSGSTILLLLSGVGAWTIASQLVVAGKESIQNQPNLSTVKSLDSGSNISSLKSTSNDLHTVERYPIKRASTTNLDIYLSDLAKQFSSRNNPSVTGYSRLRNRLILVNAVDDRPTKIINPRLRSKQKTPDKPPGAVEPDKPTNDSSATETNETTEPTSRQERINQITNANNNPANSAPSDGNSVADGGAIDLSGKEGNLSEAPINSSTLESSSFDWGWNFSEGLAEVQTGENWGYIDRTGRMVIRPRFQEAKYFSEGLASVKINDRWGYIDRKGKMVIPADFQEAGEFSEGLAAVKLAGSWGYIDRAGNFVVQPQYEEAGTFHEGLASVQIDSLWGYIDPSGVTIISPKFNNTWGFSQGIAQVKLGNRIAYIDREGNFISGRP
jgi:hypothetical protein